MYIKGDYNQDDSRFLPYSDDLMKYDIDEHWYTPTIALFKNRLGIDLIVDYGTTGANIVCENVRDIVLEYLYSNPNQYAEEIKEFIVARQIRGRKAIETAYVNQMRYMDFEGMDLMNEDNPISSRATKVLNSQRSNFLGHKGSYGNMRVNQDSTDDDGYRNGY